MDCVQYDIDAAIVSGDIPDPWVNPRYARFSVAVLSDCAPSALRSAPLSLPELREAVDCFDEATFDTQPVLGLADATNGTGRPGWHWIPMTREQLLAEIDAMGQQHYQWPQDSEDRADPEHSPTTLQILVTNVATTIVQAREWLQMAQVPDADGIADDLTAWIQNRSEYLQEMREIEAVWNWKPRPEDVNPRCICGNLSGRIRNLPTRATIPS